LSSGLCVCVLEWMQVAYLANAAVLGDQMFFVDKRVIVPRSYIAETLRGDVSPFVAAPDQVTHVLDMCTGSGCLVRGLGSSIFGACGGA
jgi:ribosomal protein L3 glutamine methyltransferase